MFGGENERSSYWSLGHRINSGNAIDTALEIMARKSVRGPAPAVG